MAALIGVLNLAFGSDPDAPGPAVVSQPDHSRTPGSVAATPSASEGATSAPATPTAVASASPSATPTVAAPLRAPLRVYNYSRRSGLARRAAAQFEQRGWQVIEVTNTRVRTEVTTVYYAPGQEAVAAQLRKEFPAIKAAAPRPPALEGSGLTVVVTREYPA